MMMQNELMNLNIQSIMNQNPSGMTSSQHFGTPMRMMNIQEVKSASVLQPNITNL